VRERRRGDGSDAHDVPVGELATSGFFGEEGNEASVISNPS
jgi:hypothetical protein